jgi:hypothetical protein
MEKDEKRPEIYRERKRDRGDSSIGMSHDQYRAKKFGFLQFKSNLNENA